MITGKDNPNSIINIITLARENARSVQDHLTKDLWQCLNEYYHLVHDKRLISSLKKGDPVSVLDELIKQVMLYYGIGEVTMERGEGRSFMNIGKYLERPHNAKGRRSILLGCKALLIKQGAAERLMVG